MVVKVDQIGRVPDPGDGHMRLCRVVQFGVGQYGERLVVVRSPGLGVFAVEEHEFEPQRFSW